MMRRIDERGELITSGDSLFVYRSEGVALNILTRLRLFLGESFRDTSDGTAWLQDVLIRTDDLTVISQTLQSRITKTPNVSEIISFNAKQDPTSRRLNITCQVLTAFGDVVDIGEINV